MDAFFADFELTSKADWLNKVTKDLRGKPLDELEHQWTEHVRLLPFFHLEDQVDPLEPMARQTTGVWEVGEVHAVTDLKTANRRLLEGLQQGVNAPVLRLSKVLSTAEWEQLMLDVEPSFIAPIVDPEFGVEEPAEWLDPYLAFLSKRKIDAADRRGAISIGEEHSGRLISGWQGFATRLPKVRKFYIDATSCYRPHQPEDEIALAAYLAFYRMVQAQRAGIDIVEAHQNLTIVLAVGAEFFRNLAKLRAFKLLWANLLEVADWPINNPPYLSVHFAPVSQGQDQYANMIKATTQAMSAVLGGADHLVIPPADVQAASPGELPRRVARNLHHVLSMEAHLDQVVDPAAGSYFVEELTRRIAERGYEQFRKMTPPAGV
jgi:methylmalonyl-CoA mutase